MNFYLHPIHKEPGTITVLYPSDRIEIEDAFELIPDKLGIKYLSENDKKYFENAPFYSNKIYNEKFVIEWKHKNLEDINDVYNPLYKVFFSLRLFKEGLVHLRYLYTTDEDNDVLVKSINYDVPFMQVDYMNIINYDLFYHEKKDFKQYFNMCHLVDNLSSNIDIALDRFNSTYYPKAVRDVLLDIMIGFEALFLKDSRIRDKGEVIAFACSMLLGKNNSERKEIKNKLSKFYRIRNKIIHGSKYNEQEIKDNYYTLKNYLRKSIIKLLL